MCVNDILRRHLMRKPKTDVVAMHLDLLRVNEALRARVAEMERNTVEVWPASGTAGYMLLDPTPE